MSKYKKLELTLGKKYNISNWKDISYIIPIRYISGATRMGYVHNKRIVYVPASYYCQVSFLDGKSELINMKTRDLRKYIKNT